MEVDIYRSLEECKSLPTLPAVATEVVRLSRRTEIDLTELTRVVEQDPAIATKLIRTARSPVYLTRGGAPNTTSQAVMRLGANAVMALALSFSLVRMQGATSGFDYPSFWKRMLLSGSAARSLAAITHCNAEEAFLAGMFQDIGMLALHEVLGARYVALIDSSSRDHLRLERLERETFGIDHREIGVWLAHRWMLPPYIEHATRSSHNPQSASGSGAFPEHSNAVALSGFIAEIWMTSKEQRVHAMRQAAECARQWLGMSGENLARLLSEVGRTVPELSRLFEIGIDEHAIHTTLEEARTALTRASLRTAADAFKAEATAERAIKQKELEASARLDPLTGLFNRGHFDAQLERAIVGARELGRPLSLVFFDLDHFKATNDKHGRDVGDAVLQAVGRVVVRCVRQLDVAARYGGEEFAIILPATDRAGAKIAAERLRKLLEKQDVLIGGGRAINVTASFGVATMDETFAVQEPADLLRATDAFLYAAKRGGRNRVVARE